MSTKSTTKPDDGAEPEVITTVRFPSSVHARLKDIAAAQHRSFSQQMRLAADQHIAWVEAQEREAA